jgi:hypothetical protein
MPVSPQQRTSVRRNNNPLPPLTPKYPSRVEVIATDVKTFHEMRRSLGAQQDRITALERDLADLRQLIIELQPVTSLKPKESR